MLYSYRCRVELTLRMMDNTRLVCTVVGLCRVCGDHIREVLILYGVDDLKMLFYMCLLVMLVRWGGLYMMTSISCAMILISKMRDYILLLMCEFGV
jgi:hypothetical protein